MTLFSLIFIDFSQVLDRIVKREGLSEREAADHMAILASTLYYLHCNQVLPPLLPPPLPLPYSSLSQIAHRDLKPSNIMYACKEGGPESIRIVDFGFAKQSRAENGMLMTPCYTAQYVSEGKEGKGLPYTSILGRSGSSSPSRIRSIM